MEFTQKDTENAAALITRAIERIEDYANKNYPAHAGSGDRRDYWGFEIESADEYGIMFRGRYNGSCHCHPEENWEYITLPWDEIIK